ncbi:MAG: Two-component hybrid sensor and regulator [candidate division Zixibacteria bacterium RBG-1]|nr:MAG: Two-component hybrid sensor and regulator [candidate division Zixibacteria bacterium RBG-1]OGC85911.1 MAG: hypothetical protein A2V73_08145 [candidate division Zixibacteria bacterium RBG_19FT_COMBO_42_43]
MVPPSRKGKGRWSQKLAMPWCPSTGSRRGNHMILIGVLLALAFWILETLIHAFIFHEGGLLQNLFPMDPNELWMRTLVCCLFIAYGIYAQFVVTKLKKSEDERLRLQGNKIPDVSIYGVTIPQQRVNGGPMIFLGVFAALTFWTIESLIHTYMFHQPGL